MDSRLGYTLLEMVLVLAIIALTIAIVLPRFTGALMVSLPDEGRRLQQVLRFASEDAQVSGVPILWLARPHSYSFERWSAKGWQPLTESPYAPYTMPSETAIASVMLDGSSGIPLTSPDLPAAGAASTDAVGTVVFWPDGTLTVGNIKLERFSSSAPQTPVETLNLALRPGPTGITVARKE